MDDGVIQEPENTITEYNSSYKFIDLFCGIGGFHQALNNINAEYCIVILTRVKFLKNYRDNSKEILLK
jgi:site-specific DNA-cytosine methylase